MVMDAYRMSLASDFLYKCKKLFKRSADEDTLHEWAVKKLNKQMPQTHVTSF